jgi:hypothetical protein
MNVWSVVICSLCVWAGGKLFSSKTQEVAECVALRRKEEEEEEKKGSEL